MVVATPQLLILLLGLGVATLVSITIVLLVQKDQMQDELNKVAEKLGKLEETWSRSPLNPDNFNASYSDNTSNDEYEFASLSEQDHWPSYRLPRNVWPLFYDLKLRVVMENRQYTGTVFIMMRVLKRTKRIVLHSCGLDITKVTALNNCRYKCRPTVQFIKDKDFLVLDFKEYFEADRLIEMTITFNGKLRDDSAGFYASTYKKPDNVIKTIASTQFEAPHARKAFPCFDEPDMKATFNISITHEKKGGYSTLSNMNSLGLNYDKNMVETVFQETVLMSTYTLAFVISDFKYKEIEVNPKGVGEPFNLRVYASPEQIDKVDFALSSGKLLLEYFIQYTKFAYPLPKMDMIALPEFKAGAMENWGLITYRETLLLYSKNISSVVNKQIVASVIAHELAHMWFGNLVTMKWWSDTWLNEGFATYYEIKALDWVYPDWKMQAQYIVYDLAQVFKVDSTLSAHPVVKPIETTDNIIEMFDTITYAKGSAMVRMLEDIVGPENFQTAIRNYLTKHQYNNTLTRDLVDELINLDLDFDVRMVLYTWTEQAGYPVVFVQKVSDTKYNLTQHRFLSNPKEYDNMEYDTDFEYTWSIPITYLTSNSSEIQRTWFHNNMKNLLIETSSPVDWIKFNVNQKGLYVVNYAKELWDKLSGVLLESSEKLSAEDRASLFGDAFRLAEAEQLGYDIALDLTKYLEKESEYIPWSSAIDSLSKIMERLVGTELHPKFQSFLQKVVKSTYEKVGWTVGDNHLNNFLRYKILSAACKYGMENCLTETSSRIDKFLKSPDERPHPDIRSAVYNYGFEKLTAEEKWEKMLDLMVNEPDATEKTNLMYALATTRNPDLISRYIDSAWNDSIIRSQDYFIVLYKLATNPVANPMVWDYYRKSWPFFVRRFGLSDRNLGRPLSAIVSYFNSQDKIEEMQEFFKKYPEAGASESARSTALQQIKSNINWLERNYKSIETWLKSNA